MGLFSKFKSLFDKKANTTENNATTERGQSSSAVNLNTYTVTLYLNGIMIGTTVHSDRNPFYFPKLDIPKGCKQVSNYTKVTGNHHECVCKTVPIEFVYYVDGGEFCRKDYNFDWKSNVPNPPEIDGFETSWEFPEPLVIQNSDIRVDLRKKIKVVPHVIFFCEGREVGKHPYCIGWEKNLPLPPLIEGKVASWDISEAYLLGSDLILHATVRPVYIYLHQEGHLECIKYSPDWKYKIPDPYVYEGREYRWDLPLESRLYKDLDIIAVPDTEKIIVSFYLSCSLYGHSSVCKGALIHPPEISVPDGHRIVWNGPKSSIKDCVWSAIIEPVSIHLFVGEKEIIKIPYSVDWMEHLPSVPEKEGYSGSWPEPPSFDGVHEDVSLRYSYTKIVHKLHIFMGDKLIETRTYDEDADQKLPKVDLKSGYKIEWTKKNLVNGDVEISGSIVPVKIHVPYFDLIIPFVNNWKKQLPPLSKEIGKSREYVIPPIMNEDIEVSVSEKDIPVIRFIIDGECVQVRDSGPVTNIDYPDVAIAPGKKIVWDDDPWLIHEGDITGHTEPIKIHLICDGNEVRQVEYSPIILQSLPKVPTRKGYDILWDVPKDLKIGNEDINILGKSQRVTATVTFCLNGVDILEKDVPVNTSLCPPEVSIEPGFKIEWSPVTCVHTDVVCMGVTKPICLIYSFKGEVVGTIPFSTSWRYNIPPCPSDDTGRYMWSLPADDAFGNEDMVISAEKISKVNISFFLNGHLICSREFEPGSEVEFPKVDIPIGHKRKGDQSFICPDHDMEVHCSTVPISLKFAYNGKTYAKYDYSESWTKKIPSAPSGIYRHGHWNVETFPENAHGDIEFSWVNDPKYTVTFTVDSEIIEVFEYYPHEHIVPPILEIPGGYRMVWDECGDAESDMIIYGHKTPVLIHFMDGEKEIAVREYSPHWRRNTPDAVTSFGVSTTWDIPDNLVFTDRDVVINLLPPPTPVVERTIPPTFNEHQGETVKDYPPEFITEGNVSSVEDVDSGDEDDDSPAWMRLASRKSSINKSNTSSMEDDEDTPSWMRRTGGVIDAADSQAEEQKEPLGELDDEGQNFDYQEFNAPDMDRDSVDNSALMRYYADAGYVCRSSDDYEIRNLPYLIETLVNICDDRRIDWYSRTLCNYALSSTVLYDLRDEEERGHVLWTVCKVLDLLMGVDSDIVLENTSPKLEFGYYRNEVARVAHLPMGRDEGSDISAFKGFMERYSPLTSRSERENYSLSVLAASEILCAKEEYERTSGELDDEDLVYAMHSIFADIGTNRESFRLIPEMYVPLNYLLGSYRCDDSPEEHPWDIFQEIYNLENAYQYPDFDTEFTDPYMGDILVWDLVSFYIGFEHGVNDRLSFGDSFVSKYLDEQLSLIDESPELEGDVTLSFFYDCMSRTGVNFYLNNFAFSDSTPTYAGYLEMLNNLFRDLAGRYDRNYINLSKVESHIKADAEKKLIRLKDLCSPSRLKNRDVNRRLLDDILEGKDD